MCVFLVCLCVCVGEREKREREKQTGIPGISIMRTKKGNGVLVYVCVGCVCACVFVCEWVGERKERERNKQAFLVYQL